MFESVSNATQTLFKCLQTLRKLLTNVCNAFQTLFTPFANASQTVCKAFQTLAKPFANASQTLCKRFANALQTLRKGFSNPFQFLWRAGGTSPQGIDQFFRHLATKTLKRGHCFTESFQHTIPQSKQTQPLSFGQGTETLTLVQKVGTSQIISFLLWKHWLHCPSGNQLMVKQKRRLKGGYLTFSQVHWLQRNLTWNRRPISTKIPLYNAKRKKRSPLTVHVLKERA